MIQRERQRVHQGVGADTRGWNERTGVWLGVQGAYFKLGDPSAW